MDTMNALDAMGVFDEFQEVDDNVGIPSRRRDTFPPQLRDFTFADRAYLICGIELDPSSTTSKLLKKLMGMGKTTSRLIWIDYFRVTSVDWRSSLG